MSLVITEIDYCPLAGDTPAECSARRNLGLTVCLSGLLEQSANCILELTRLACESRGVAFSLLSETFTSETLSEDEIEDELQEINRVTPLYYAHALRDLRCHALGVKAGIHTEREFLDFYGLADPIPAGHWFRQRRLLNVLNLVEVAKAIGVTVAQLSKWERGEHQFDESTTRKLTSYFGDGESRS